MGAWGTGPFDNDDAADWVYELEESEGTSIIREALEAVGPDEYLEAPECSIAIAAAEVVAALKGRPLEELPPEVVVWVDAGAAEIDDDVVAEAVLAIHRIESESELLELWEDSEEFEEWKATIEDLQERLGGG